MFQNILEPNSSNSRFSQNLPITVDEIMFRVNYSVLGVTADGCLRPESGTPHRCDAAGCTHGGDGLGTSATPGAGECAALTSAV